jgi:hypothetical protein
MKDRTRDDTATRDATPKDKAVTELDGFIGLGMKREAFRIVREHLRAKTINPDLFHGALNALLTLADTTKSWRPLVEAAHSKLSQRGKRKARSMMLCFYSSLQDNKAAYRFIPRHFVGPIDAVEMMFAIDTLLALDKIKEARPVVRKAVNLLDSLVNPEGRAMLMSCIAAYLSKVQEWDTATHMWESLQCDRLMAESATFGLLEVHLQRTLETIRSARKSLDHLRQNPDPNLETIVPGNDDARWRAASAKLNRIERLVLRGLKANGSAPDGPFPPPIPLES